MNLSALKNLNFALWFVLNATSVSAFPGPPERCYQLKVIDSEPYVENRLQRLRDLANFRSSQLTPNVRFQNYEQFKDPTARITRVSKKQLSEQWGSDSLSLPVVKGYSPFGKAKNLRQGDKITLKRILRLTELQLNDFLRSGVSTSNWLNDIGNDLKSSNKLFEEQAITLRDVIGRQHSKGYWAISTAYTAAYAEGRIGYEKVAIHRRNGQARFVFTLRYEVPVEALVAPGQFPQHTLSNPTSYGFISPSTAESEITFIDYIPKAWLKTNLSKLKRDAQRVLAESER